MTLSRTLTAFAVLSASSTCATTFASVSSFLLSSVSLVS